MCGDANKWGDDWNTVRGSAICVHEKLNIYPPFPLVLCHVLTQLKDWRAVTTRIDHLFMKDRHLLWVSTIKRADIMTRKCCSQTVVHCWRNMNVGMCPEFPNDQERLQWIRSAVVLVSPIQVWIGSSSYVGSLNMGCQWLSEVAILVCSWWHAEMVFMG